MFWVFVFHGGSRATPGSLILYIAECSCRSGTKCAGHRRRGHGGIDSPLGLRRDPASVWEKKIPRVGIPHYFVSLLVFLIKKTKQIVKFRMGSGWIRPFIQHVFFAPVFFCFSWSKSCQASKKGSNLVSCWVESSGDQGLKCNQFNTVSIWVKRV